MIERHRVLACGGDAFTTWKFHTGLGETAKPWFAHPLALADGGQATAAAVQQVSGLQRFLYDSGLDKLPQLLNILRGEMSWVGPRTVSVGQVELHSPWLPNLLTVKPGVTGPWAVGWKRSLDDEMRVTMVYIRNWTIWLDLQILAQTALRVLPAGAGQGEAARTVSMEPIALLFQQADPGRKRRAALFLDRDGVLNQNRADYVRTWEQVEFLPGVFEAMQRLAGSPFVVVVVTNQSAVGRGLMTVEALAAINQGIVRQVQQAGGRIDAVYSCPHRPDEGCPCRKPRPGMLLQAALDFGIDLEQSYLVGDARSDVQAGLAAGCQPLLVRTGRGAKQMAGLAADGLSDTPVVADLAAAVAWILSRGDRAEGVTPWPAPV